VAVEVLVDKICQLAALLLVQVALAAEVQVQQILQLLDVLEQLTLEVAVEAVLTQTKLAEQAEAV
jgi:hypothetical protein